MPTPSPLDLTTSSAVQQWLINQGSTYGSDELQAVQDAITAFSVYVLRLTGRGPQSGVQPDPASGVSPLVQVCPYSEVYDGNGASKLQLRNWPIVSVTSLTINTISVPQSTAPNVQGWVIDGSGKFIALRGGYGSYSGGLLVNTFQTLFMQRSWGGFGGGNIGFNQGIQNVLISYTAGFAGTPLDLELCARRTVAKNYKQRAHIGNKSTSLAGGAGTQVFDWDMLPEDWSVLLYYKRSASVP
jgi:hypothetical protein